MMQSETQISCAAAGQTVCTATRLTSREVMNSLCEALLFVVKSSCCSQIPDHLQLFWAPGGDDGYGTKQTRQLNSSCSNSTGTGVSQHDFTLLHLSCDGRMVTKNSILSLLVKDRNR